MYEQRICTFSKLGQINFTWDKDRNCSRNHSSSFKGQPSTKNCQRAPCCADGSPITGDRKSDHFYNQNTMQNATYWRVYTLASRWVSSTPYFHYTNYLVSADSFYAKFTNTTFQKIPIPHLTGTMKQKCLH